MQFRVINKHLDKTCVEGGERVYIGRPSPLGNPFVLKQHGTRDQVIAKFRDHLVAQLEAGNPEIVNELARILRLGEQRPVELACFCQPAACHGDVIREVLLSRKDQILSLASR